MMKTPSKKAWWLGLALWLAGGGMLLAGAQQPPPSEQKQGPLKPKPEQEEKAPYALRVEVPVVNVDVTVMDRDGNLIGGLRREHFRVYQDGVEQEIVAFAPTEAPLTTVLLVEASPALGYLLYQNLETAYLFLNQLRKGDWIALVGYDIKPRVEVDFTQDRRAIIGGLRKMQYGSGRFSEVALYDALADTLDRLKEVDGKKSIVIIAGGVPPDVFGRGGIDTISKLTWDQVRRIARQHSVTIFAIGLSWPIERYLERRAGFGGRVGPQLLDVRMGEAQLKDLAEQTGGRAYFPRFIGQLPNIYGEIGAMLRNQYSLAFRPKNFRPDGQFHKIKVKLVGPDGKPLKVVNQKGKKIKYKIYARKGYHAPKA
ncbi:MAG: VWA domain-containing protein [Terriglobia bacterium]